MTLLTSVTLPFSNTPCECRAWTDWQDDCFLPWEMGSKHLSPLFQSLGPISPSEKWAHPTHPVKGARRSQRTGSRTQCLPQKLGYSEMHSPAWVLWLHFGSLDLSSSYPFHTCARSGIPRTILPLQFVFPFPPPFPLSFLFFLSSFFSVEAKRLTKFVLMPLLFNTEEKGVFFLVINVN